MNIPLVSPTSVGGHIKKWRQLRRLSQMDLALEIGVSSRHISFVETGKSRPSRDLIVMICDALEVPLRDRNDMLKLAGCAGLYSELDLNSPEMAHVKSMFESVMQQFDPYGSVCMDVSWGILMENRSYSNFVNLFFEKEELPEGVRNNMLKFVFHPQGLSQYIQNWTEFAPQFLRRIRGAMDAKRSDEYNKLFEELMQYPTFPEFVSPDLLLEEPKLMVPFSLKKGDIALNLFCVTMRLGSPKDVTLDELHVESYLPADPETKSFIEAMS